uniref:Uncharacterized protein n=1 Tax=Palpitomonas bilix TaxID=652834 RepID=A0A7S3GA77_9EUKA|mmetsp:Transcript_39781/g.102463  ORF Transcript_39781/g.102463 Transcript_39781/m.102463 type:complete len:208 (+) Transcript_39781:30-653(+)
MYRWFSHACTESHLPLPFSTYTRASPAIKLEKSVTTLTIVSTTKRKGMNRREVERHGNGVEDAALRYERFHLEVATSHSFSDGVQVAYWSLLSISVGGSIGHPSMLLPPFPRESILQNPSKDAALYFPLRSEHLTCLFGYAYTYTITFRQEYDDTRLESVPYLGSNPVERSTSSRGSCFCRCLNFIYTSKQCDLTLAQSELELSSIC